MTKGITAVILSLARSGYRSLIQLAFLLSHGSGLLLKTIYNRSPPDLYPSNAHHKLGWALTWIAVAQLIMSHFETLSRTAKRFAGLGERCTRWRSFLPISPNSLEERGLRRQCLDDFQLSSDDDQDNEPYMEAPSCSSATSTPSTLHGLPSRYYVQENDEQINTAFGNFPLFFTHRGLDKVQARWSSTKVIRQARRLFLSIHVAADALLPILGFTTFCTGIATFGRFFVNHKTPT